jgi:hypothetical protein
MNPGHALISCFLKIQCHIILPSLFMSPKWSLPFRFPDYRYKFFMHILYTHTHIHVRVYMHIQIQRYMHAQVCAHTHTLSVSFSLSEAFCNTCVQFSVILCQCPTILLSNCNSFYSARAHYVHHYFIVCSSLCVLLVTS